MDDNLSYKGMEKYKEELEKIVKEKENSCTICSCGMEDNDITQLKCGHKYHYDCIKMWYKSIAGNNYNSGTVAYRTCPYCRQDGGYLPLKEGDIWQKNVHAPIRSRKLEWSGRCKGITKLGNRCKLSGFGEEQKCHKHKSK